MIRGVCSPISFDIHHSQAKKIADPNMRMMIVNIKVPGR